jgi:flagellar basal body rod protein FlgB
LLNAYIYAIIDDNTVDMDKELYNIERLSRNFDIFAP